MKKLIWGAAFLAVVAQAEPCAKLEFAELDSLPKEELLRMRCQYLDQMLDPGLNIGTRWGLAVANRCATETGRMDRILARKYALKNTGDPAIPYFVEVSAMCNR